MTAYLMHCSLIDKNNNDKEVCVTSACVEAAANLMGSIDETLSPCDDFFEYACAGWNRYGVLWCEAQNE